MDFKSNEWQNSPIYESAWTIFLKWNCCSIKWSLVWFGFSVCGFRESWCGRSSDTFGRHIGCRCHFLVCLRPPSGQRCKPSICFEKRVYILTDIVFFFLFCSKFQMVFGNCGVLQEMTSTKGFVEMTGIDAETSQDIADVILTFLLTIPLKFMFSSFSC